MAAITDWTTTPIVHFKHGDHAYVGLRGSTVQDFCAAIAFLQNNMPATDGFNVEFEIPLEKLDHTALATTTSQQLHDLAEAVADVVTGPLNVALLKLVDEQVNEKFTEFAGLLCRAFEDKLPLVAFQWLGLSPSHKLKQLEIGPAFVELPMSLPVTLVAVCLYVYKATLIPADTIDRLIATLYGTPWVHSLALYNKDFPGNGLQPRHLLAIKNKVFGIKQLIVPDRASLTAKICEFLPLIAGWRLQTMRLHRASTCSLVERVKNRYGEPWFSRRGTIHTFLIMRSYMPALFEITLHPEAGNDASILATKPDPTDNTRLIVAFGDLQQDPNDIFEQSVPARLPGLPINDTNALRLRCEEILDPPTNYTCHKCDLPNGFGGIQLQQCGWCNLAWYCDDYCQTEAWYKVGHEGHKKMCDFKTPATRVQHLLDTVS